MSRPTADAPDLRSLSTTIAQTSRDQGHSPQMRHMIFMYGSTGTRCCHVIVNIFQQGDACEGRSLERGITALERTLKLEEEL